MKAAVAFACGLVAGCNPAVDVLGSSSAGASSASSSSSSVSSSTSSSSSSSAGGGSSSSSSGAGGAGGHQLGTPGGGVGGDGASTLVFNLETQYEITALVVDSTDLYWISRNTSDPTNGSGAIVGKVSVNGGSGYQLATTSAAENWAIAVDDSSVFWVGDGLWTVPKEGGSPQLLHPGNGPESPALQGLGIDSHGLYFTSGQDLYLWADETPTSNALITPIDQPGTLAVRDDRLAWTDASFVYLTEYNNKPPAAKPLASITSPAPPIALSKTKVAWIDDGQLFVASDPTDVQHLASTKNARFVAADDDAIYWTDAYNYISSVTEDGATSKTLVLEGPSDQPGPIAVDANYVYWADQAGGSIKRFPK